MIKDKLIAYFGKNIRELFSNIDYEFFQKVEEIRIRIEKIILFKIFDREYFLYSDGTVNEKLDLKKTYTPTFEDIRQTIETMSDYSIYAFEQDIKNGYITLKGGFRVGVVGTAVIEEGKIKSIKNISAVNVRIAREIKGCSKKLLPFIFSPKFNSTIIISSPNSGKTTLLRDIIREASIRGQNVAVVDERSEIGGSYRGINQMDLGFRTDILDRCPKPQGMLNLLRSMSPNIIAVDEIGGNEDINAIEKVSNSGVNLICTVHAQSIEEFKEKQEFNTIFKKKIFKRFVVINKENGVVSLKGMYDENFNVISERIVLWKYWVLF